jgi:hypothetical protein
LRKDLEKLHVAGSAANCLAQKRQNRIKKMLPISSSREEKGSNSAAADI